MKNYYFVVKEYDLEAHGGPQGELGMGQEGVSYTKLRIFARDLRMAYSKAKNHVQSLQQEYQYCSYSLLTLNQFNQINGPPLSKRGKKEARKIVNLMKRRSSHSRNNYGWYLIFVGILALAVWLFWLSQVAI